MYLGALLFSTGKRGRIVESIHVALSRNETRQNFNIWVYGNEKLVRGSGLFVGETGVEANHHFLLPSDARSFRFEEGRYKLEVFLLLVSWATKEPISTPISNTRYLSGDVELACRATHGRVFRLGPRLIVLSAVCRKAITVDRT